MRRAQPLFHRREVRVILGLVATLVVAGSVLVIGAAAGWFGTDEVTLDPVPTAAAALTSDEAEYYDYIAPRLHEVGAQARELARLGESRSRDIFDLQAHASRLTDLAAEIDAYVSEHGTPPLFALAHQSYIEGIDRANRAIEETERSVLSADWERLGRVVAVFVAGAENLEQAGVLLDSAGGEPASGTPT